MDDLLTTLNVSRETFLKLKNYQSILEKWQARMNLVSPSSLAHCWERHILDSLQLLLYIPEKPVSVVDLGSGAGFPGMVLAIARPGTLNVTLVESNQKKCLFLENVSRETMTKVSILRSRIEDLAFESPFDVITARGLTSLTQLLNYWWSFTGENSTTGLILKGKEYSREVDEAKRKWDFGLEIYPSITDSEARILKITSLRKKVL